MGAQDGLGGSKAERVGDSLGSPISEQQGHANAGEIWRAEKQEQEEPSGEQGDGAGRLPFCWHDRKLAAHVPIQNNSGLPRGPRGPLVAGWACAKSIAEREKEMKRRWPDINTFCAALLNMAVEPLAMRYPGLAGGT